MNRSVVVGACAVLAVALGGCDLIDADAIEGSGDIIVESREVAGFDAIEVVGSGEVTVDVTGVEALWIAADDNLMPLLTSEVVDGTLVLSVEDDTSISPSQEVEYRITVADIGGLAIVGSADFLVSDIDTVSFGVEVTGSGDVTLLGIAGDFAVDIRGSGDINAANLEATTASIDIAGSGDVVVNASDELSISISGSGNVEYIGSPSLTQSVSGSGEISQR